MNKTVIIDLWVMQEPGGLDAAVADALLDLLDDSEMQRWQGYGNAGERDRFLLTRGLLRHVLATYTDMAPGALKFNTSPLGKPELAGGKPDFNLSHTRGLAVLAVSRDASVGIDVELLDRQVNAPALAQRYFSATEQAALDGLDHDAYHRAFLAIWTVKEAFLKALGLGRRIPLDSFSVVMNGQPKIVLTEPGSEHDHVVCRHWFHEEHSSIALAVCVDPDQAVEVRFRTWVPQSPTPVLCQAGSGTPQSS
jgi:4'-phosphopantetheinyl transferase